MVETMNEAKKGKLSHEDRTVVTIFGLLVPYLISNKVSDTLKKIKVAPEKLIRNTVSLW